MRPRFGLQFVNAQKRRTVVRLSAIRRSFLVATSWIALTLLTVFTPNAQAASSSQAFRIADFILSLQDANGAISDAKQSAVVNEDSNMEYALMGLAAAYAASHNPRYLAGLEKGIDWLAAREEMTDPRWKGAWFYTYSPQPPYGHVPTSPGGGVKDVRGVDATSALFVHLLYLHSAVTGKSDYATRYSANARAALDFLLANNFSPDGFSMSSWQLKGGKWSLWRYQYAADQVDVYLGFASGAALYGDPRYANTANFLKSNTPAMFYSSSLKRYAVGRFEGNSPDIEFDGFDGVFPNGYIPWVLGINAQNLAAHNWMKSKVQSDGSIVAASREQKYSLSIGVYAASAAALGQQRPEASINWLLGMTYSPPDGGVKDSSTESTKFANVAGFTVIGLLGAPAMPPRTRPSDKLAPSVPTDLVATATSSSQINLSWEASTDNAGVAGYKIFRDDVPIATVSNINYSDTGLSPLTTYRYNVSAYDVAGNDSEQTSSASATTQFLCKWKCRR